MDLSQIISLLEAGVRAFNSFFGTEIPEGAAAPIAVTAAAPFVVLTGYAGIRRSWLTYRRWKGEKEALDADGHAVVENIKGHLENLSGEIKRAAKNKTNKELLPLLELLNNRISKTEDLVSDSNEAETPEQRVDRNGRMPRRLMVRLVRETVLSNLWAGNYFDETRRRRHEYRATFEDAQRQWISVTVRTPYALPPQSDDELPYSIDVRQANRYVMRIQWDPFQHDEIEIKYVIRGSWEDAILSWNVSQQYIPKVLNTDSSEEQKVEVVA